MSKYIIEIEDKLVGGLYKAKAFRTLVFDEEGLSRLEKVEEEGKEDRTYYFITDDLDIQDEWDFGRGVDRMRKEVGNYFTSFNKAEHVRNRILEFLDGGATNDEIR